MADAPDVSDPWTAVTWEGARRAALRHGAALTLVERIAWLEDAHRLVEHLDRRRLNARSSEGAGQVQDRARSN